MKFNYPHNLPQRHRLQSLATIAILSATTIGAFAGGHDRKPPRYFQRVATFPVFQNSDVTNETVAEIVTASKDGNTLIYTDSALEAIGFVNIKKTLPCPCRWALSRSKANPPPSPSPAATRWLPW